MYCHFPCFSNINCRAKECMDLNGFDQTIINVIKTLFGWKQLSKHCNSTSKAQLWYPSKIQHHITIFCWFHLSLQQTWVYIYFCPVVYVTLTVKYIACCRRHSCDMRFPGHHSTPCVAWIICALQVKGLFVSVESIKTVVNIHYTFFNVSNVQRLLLDNILNRKRTCVFISLHWNIISLTTKCTNINNISTIIQRFPSCL